MGERLADRTNLGPDHRNPDDVPLPGTEDLTPLDAETWEEDDPYAYECDCPDCSPVDLDELAAVLGPPWITLTPSARYL